MDKNKFKYFINIESAYTDNGEYYLEGIATGLQEDLNDRKMLPGVIESFFKKIKSGEMPLRDGHLKEGSIISEIGEVIDCSIIENGDLRIKALVDKDVPQAKMIYNKVMKGKKIGFSIEGYVDPDEQRIVYSEELNKYITEILNLMPTGISVVTQPAYRPSFANVVYSSVSNNLINNNKKVDKKDDKKTKVTASTNNTNEVIENTDNSDNTVVNTDSEATETVETTEESSSAETETVAKLENRIAELEAKLEENKKAEEIENSITEVNKINSSIESKIDKVLELIENNQKRINELESIPNAKKSRVLSSVDSEIVNGNKGLPKTFEEKYALLMGK